MHLWLRLLALIGLITPASAASMDKTLMKLEPEERAHQACILRGMDTLKRAKKLKKIDRLKTSILSRATFDGATVVAKGAAVRADGHWYRLKFTCTVGENQMTATSFTYDLGTEIPEDRYEDLGLWK
ncbi:DUF930 domain-containing protein [Hyphomicrobium sp. B1]|jgi:hypothetical protein|uniref:DUF930 domain-containing protein n=1 Tax=unclassified Hyphomicrobium TaxID=2619925 RepID=UPI000213D31A|nr:MULTISPECIES: DUF930 domain-containing protein [unclassified Hyphomicrobium]CCB64312.1 conserved exported protein of unknown function [Hyphomicrobium sp. MC1]